MSAQQPRFGANATTILLIRHGHTNAVGRVLSGRLPGVLLSPRGDAQAVALAAHLSSVRISAVYTSPLERAVTTAEYIAARQGRTPCILPALLEADYGEWAGMTFDALGRDPRWHRFNRERGTAIVPSGESAQDVQTRIVSALRQLHTHHPGQTIAVVSHADPIRYAVLHYSGMPLDSVHQLIVDPASVTTLLLDRRDATVTHVNEGVVEHHVPA